MSLIPEHAWEAIGHTEYQLILYHPASHALQVRNQPHHDHFLSDNITGSTISAGENLEAEDEQVTPILLCPSCARPLPTGAGNVPEGLAGGSRHPAPTNYFRVLEQVHGSTGAFADETTPPPFQNAYDDDPDTSQDLPSRGYYARFFHEEKRLGMGAAGSVFLATHHIDGDVLGQYAVKKIAIGRSKSYLHKMLREVRLLGALRHPNIIAYHHAWIDTTRFSKQAASPYHVYGPDVPALYVLMMYASAGNLDSYLSTRSYSHLPTNHSEGVADNESFDNLPKEERIKEFKRRRQSLRRPSEGGQASGNWSRRRENRAIMLLGWEEILHLFSDIMDGLSFLHSQCILHLDLKCSNVLLHWEEGQLVPRALLSDFGTSEEMLKGNRERSGHTGTMEYMAPETLVHDAVGHYRPSDSYADIWSCGMIFHKLLFLRLPYGDTEDYDALREEILAYPGFIPSEDVLWSLERRHMPPGVVDLLYRLLSLTPEKRPMAYRVKRLLSDIQEYTSQMGLQDVDSALKSETGMGEVALRRSIVDIPSDVNVQPFIPPRTILTRIKSRVSRSLRVATRRGYLRPHQPILPLALFSLKMISIQPAIFGANVPAWAAILLLVLALGDLVGEGKYWSWLLVGVHAGVLYALPR
ncbi:IKS protein kinase [Cryptococcus wingfieldii CBS 7118]|uniref:IKS protein kinase n=1 Tax=Cryptococcus wingfieldii CBS 7118 TaxID=1295528 RepID=A0A1E3K3D1_9TREE|nr:IKS protein kinase [Cryptococcus wingfieldii CBS 7118]ODO07600.1 IKS protein kinase [Cryptococcus wingfieldii CBS 7118]